MSVRVVGAGGRVNRETMEAARAEDGPERREFVRWVEGRFYEESRAGRRFMIVDGSGAGQTMSADFSGGGWVRWQVAGAWWQPGMGVDAARAPYIRMVRVEENDRSPASRGPVVAFPLDVLFGEGAGGRMTRRQRLTRWMRRRSLGA